MPLTGSSFVILKQVDSTNNYAMAKVHAGLAKHGDGWYSGKQTAGKGQRGKQWLTGADENIALSVILNPKQLNIIHPFRLLMAIGLASFDFLAIMPEMKPVLNGQTIFIGVTERQAAF